ncbi:MAG: cysteine desulfurase [Clostridia bacterium]|nr:cysteine desulfurase [Clostridia bacterium]
MALKMEHYLDNAATTKTCEKAKEAAINVMENIYGNPSSTHEKGRQAKNLLEDCRKTVADALFASSEEIIFTSCGSESDNFAIIMGAELKKRNGNHIISSSVEHDAVRKALDLLETRGYKITRLKPDKSGAVSVSSVLEAITDKTVLISLMTVNNETGAVTDIKKICEEVKDINPDILIHTDAVQGFLKVPLKAKTLGADMISISGHKIHAVKGIGALYVKKGIKIKPLIVGGEQESGKRAGTEALPQIAAFAAACKEDPEIKKMAELKEYLTEELLKKIPEIEYIKTDAPHILNISLIGYRSEVLMNYLETLGVFVSKSSACKQGKRSHVLEAIGLKNEYIDGALRIGISRFNTKDDIDALVNGLSDAKKLAHR